MTDNKQPNYLTMILGGLVLVFATLYFSKETTPKITTTEGELIPKTLPLPTASQRETYAAQPQIKNYTPQERDRFMLRWRDNITIGTPSGTWFSWLEGGGFRDVEVMVTNNHDVKIDEIWVRFKVQKRSSNKVCFDEVFKFKNIPGGEGKSLKASAPCGMRPPEIDVVYMKCSHFDYEFDANEE